MKQNMIAHHLNQVPLTNQVPYLNNMPGVANDERFGFLPFIGGLAIGGLLFNGGRPCCGGYNYPVYQQPIYYPQPVYYPQPTYYPQQTYPGGYQQQMVQNGYYGPYLQPNDSTIIESNKYYIS